MTNPSFATRNGLPPNGTVGQVVGNTAPGVGAWITPPLSLIQLAILGYVTLNTPIDIDFHGDTTLVTWNTGSAGLASLNVSGCTALTTLRLAGDTSLTSLNMSGDTSLTSLDVIGCAALASVGISTNTALTTLNASGTALTSLDVSTNAALTSLDVSSCAITVQATINAILVALDGFGLSNGICDLSGGTNAAPGAPGLAAKASLIGKGWSVITN